MAIWVVEFSNGGYKIRKNQHTQRKLLNFENWVNRCQKLGIILKSDLKIDVIKKYQ